MPTVPRVLTLRPDPTLSRHPAPSRGRSTVRTLIATVASLGAVAGVLAAAPSSASAARTTSSAVVTPAATTKSDVTSPVERARVDAVPTPHLAWEDCYGGEADCATVRLPKDYDDLTGPKVDVFLARRPADDPAHKIGTLFLNPGGPGGSGADMVASISGWLPLTLLSRFDIVGFDPRGQAGSDRVRCFRSAGEQQAVIEGLGAEPFPVTAQEQAGAVAAAAKLGQACSSHGARLASSVSTAEVARDLDVLRRAFGERKLTYLGWSYGTYLGSVYANLFPDRVRAIAVDGVIDPEAWQGNAATRSVPMFDRTKSGDGAWSALQEILTRCGEAGADRCRLAALTPTPLASFREVMAQLKTNPLSVTIGNGDKVTVSYADMSWLLLLQLYDVYAGETVDDLVSDLYASFRATDAKERREARRALADYFVYNGLSSRGSAGAAAKGAGSDKVDGDKAGLWDSEAYYAVLCTDARHPDTTDAYAQDSAALDARAPYVGLPWLWSSMPCAEKSWTARDEDTYQGTFTHRTAAPLLVVGNLWDPATNVAGARRLAELMPSSRLLISDSWGHTAFGTSRCVTGAVTRYLVSGRLPAEGTTCTGDHQPFTSERGLAARVAPQTGLTPTVTPTPRDPDGDGAPAPVTPPRPLGGFGSR